uniref:Deoxyribonuclease n=1 Tax=Chelonoidis abingdonii TaxID=106734 RepID=A0A8C0QHI8_CHEAB
MGAMRPALALLSLAYLLHTAATLRICAFNIRSFGDSKLSNETIAGIIVNIVQTYNIAMVQEVHDTDGSAVRKLMDQLNRASLQPYSYVVSEPLGRNSYKEQYLFVYRGSVCEREREIAGVMGDGSVCTQKMAVCVTCVSAEVQEFVLVPLLTPPNEAVAEIDALYDVYLDVIDKWGTDNIVFLGDFNADCSYWLIPDSADTTVSYPNCTYDRIVVSGSELQRGMVAGSAKVNSFQETFHLQREDVTLAVSDPFPVEVTLKAR